MVVSIPGFGSLSLKYLVMDYNGTLAIDGELIDGVKDALIKLSREIELHVLTADTFGKAASGLSGIPCKLKVLPREDQQGGKLNYIRMLGADSVVSIGNGRNDQLMLKESALGIAVILGECASTEALMSADLISTSILSALELLAHPLRLTATLRS
ncbi:MAG: ATPase P [Desulfobacterales bacterium]|jgi:soluble P-type ATPase|nr:ATPase P [Desulfobacterales bacterium]